MTRRIPRTVQALLTCALMAGCSEMSEESLKVRATDEVKESTRETSSEILDLIDRDIQEARTGLTTHGVCTTFQSTT
ncbi:hypothetical protein [Streptomyces lydicus]|uniref:hypothetical protein n=1 Tax=Streptomyces lydicus TaxID=47763 RepID=UPI000F8CC4CE|nr:hypothetical protein [Streptomyces lydicus]